MTSSNTGKSKKPSRRAAHRPRVIHTPARIAVLVGKLEKYIDVTPVPIVAEFAYKEGIDRTALYDNPEFSTLLKKLIAKKEAQLEKLGLMNKINLPMAIFSLKQLGWRDRFEHEISEGREKEIDKALKDIADAMRP